ncbi:hypothetical protein Z043_100059 [Scleropages formosus]|uniref:C-CAP/cofactor C-like domain-containing protein n=1 Tax=Scleropages formosus TaxID=113540 RepID=A0A0P7VEV5_SCLFO|nr:hypothetical protein Z043_100059 [Scleropages formosus]
MLFPVSLWGGSTDLHVLRWPVWRQVEERARCSPPPSAGASARLLPRSEGEETGLRRVLFRGAAVVRARPGDTELLPFCLQQLLAQEGRPQCRPRQLFGTNPLISGKRAFFQGLFEERRGAQEGENERGPIVPSSEGPCPPPPPPPPGPPPVFADESPKAEDSAALHSALFAQLNQGEAITKGLKHVSDSQKTHKNPGLRSQHAVPASSPSKSQSPSALATRAPVQSHPPLLQLEGKKWRVEHQNQAHDLVISETELRQVVYIFNCSNSTLQIKGKVNSIIVDNCKKLGLVFDNVVGIVEVINSRDIQLQVMGRVPTISINKTEGCHVYLSQEALDCEIISAKSSEMNILVPHGDDYVSVAMAAAGEGT